MMDHTVDFSDFIDGTQEQREAVSAELLSLFHNQGVAKMINCGISDGVIHELMTWVLLPDHPSKDPTDIDMNKRFFDLPTNVKMKGAHPEAPNPHRGYTRFGRERVSAVTADAKESFDQGPNNDLLHPNIWIPDEDLVGFRAFMESFFDIVRHAQQQILSALAISLKLPEHYFDPLHNRDDCELRLTYYPAIQLQRLQTDTSRISEHHDWGTITIVFQDTTGGLEFERKDEPDVFIPIESKRPTEVVINVGDALQRWSNGYLHSVNHRVKIPAALKDKDVEIVPERRSISAFCKPNRDVSLRPWAMFCGDQRPLYPDITAYEYNQSLLKTTY